MRSKISDYPSPAPIEDPEEVFEEAAKEEQPKTPYQKWDDWFHLSCDHSFSPDPTDIWDGAIDTVCFYLRNEMCMGLGLPETDKILEQTKKKFKSE